MTGAPIPVPSSLKNRTCIYFNMCKSWNMKVTSKDCLPCRLHWSSLMPHLVTNTFNSALPPQIMCHLSSSFARELHLISGSDQDQHQPPSGSTVRQAPLPNNSSALLPLQLYHYAPSAAANSSPALTAQATNQQLMSISTLVRDRHSFGLQAITAKA